MIEIESLDFGKNLQIAKCIILHQIYSTHPYLSVQFDIFRSML